MSGNYFLNRHIVPALHDLPCNTGGVNRWVIGAHKKQAGENQGVKIKGSVSFDFIS